MSLISWLKDRLFCDLAIDLGTTNTLVYLKGKGIIVQEPSMVVINRATGKVEAVCRKTSKGDAGENSSQCPGHQAYEGWRHC